MRSAYLIANTYFNAFKACGGDVRRLGTTTPIPTFDIETIKNLCHEHIKRYGNQRTGISISPDSINIIGDLHGNLHNLFIIYNKYGFPPMTKYLFLGNMIEFGEYSLEVVTLLLAQQILFPQAIFLLKGITESNSLFMYRGLQHDIEQLYNDFSVYDLFLQVFTQLPICAFVYDQVLCTQAYWITELYHSSSSDHKVNHYIPRNDDAYKNFVSEFGNVDEDALKKVRLSLDVGLIILGCCKVGDYYQTFENTSLISSCNTDYGGLIKVEKDKDSMVEFFTSCEAVERKKCHFTHIKERCVINCPKCFTPLRATQSKKLSLVNNKVLPMSYIGFNHRRNYH